MVERANALTNLVFDSNKIKEITESLHETDTILSAEEILSDSDLEPIEREIVVKTDSQEATSDLLKPKIHESAIARENYYPENLQRLNNRYIPWPNASQ